MEAAQYWKNQYINKVLDTPEFILEESKGEFSSPHQELFLEKKERYSSLFLEIGSGSGMHLLSLAKENPDTLCIGVELRYKRAFRTVEKGLSQGITNLHMIRGNIHNSLSLFTHKELQKIFIHFPDPWEKRRWNKHRLIQEPFLTNVLEKLSKNGHLSFRTDHKEYYKSASALLKSKRELEISWSTPDLFNSPHAPKRPTSEFESLFVKQNKIIGALILIKKEADIVLE